MTALTLRLRCIAGSLELLLQPRCPHSLGTCILQLALQCAPLSLHSHNAPLQVFHLLLEGCSGAHTKSVLRQLGLQVAVGFLKAGQEAQRVGQVGR